MMESLCQFANLDEHEIGKIAQKEIREKFELSAECSHEELMQTIFNTLKLRLEAAGENWEDERIESAVNSYYRTIA